MGDVVVIDDDRALLRLVGHWLEREGHRVRGFDDPVAGEEDLRSQGADVVLLDLELGGGCDGRDVLDRLQATGGPAVVMMTAHGEVPAVVDAMRRGAFDYLVKPVSRTKLATTVRNAAERQQLKAAERQLTRVQAGQAYRGMLGRSPAMTQLVGRLERVAPTDVTVLVRGESGTGKELVARAVHDDSRRSSRPFVAINCAAIPANLQASELFGHEKGSFTGADAQRKGRFEQAHGGTLFLDEVAELTPDLQATLLRVLQERRLYRVGGDREVSVDVRVVAASHRDLAEEVRQGRFREDLYYRLAVFEVVVPPLRERHDDVRLLAEHFVEEAATAMGRATPALSPAATARLLAHGWPGNVRELRNAMQAAAVVAGDVVTVDDLPSRVRGAAAPLSAPVPHHAPTDPHHAPTAPHEAPTDPDVQHAAPAPVDGLRPMERLERDAIAQALERSQGNVSAVIRELHIPRTSLYRKLKKYGLRS